MEKMWNTLCLALSWCIKLHVFSHPSHSNGRNILNNSKKPQCVFQHIVTLQACYRPFYVRNYPVCWALPAYIQLYVETDTEAAAAALLKYNSKFTSYVDSLSFPHGTPGRQAWGLKRPQFVVLSTQDFRWQKSNYIQTSATKIHSIGGENPKDTLVTTHSCACCQSRLSRISNTTNTPRKGRTECILWESIYSKSFEWALSI